MAGVEASRGLRDSSARRAPSWHGRSQVLTEGQATAAVAAATRARVAQPFTLLGEGFRWQQVDSGQAITLYRNTFRPSPVQGADTDDQICAGPRCVDRSAAASITLAFGGKQHVASNLYRARIRDCNARQSGRRADHLRGSAGRARGRRPRDRRRLRVVVDPRRERHDLQPVHPRSRRAELRRGARGIPDGAEHHAHPRARGRPRHRTRPHRRGPGQHHVSSLLSAGMPVPACDRPGRPRWAGVHLSAPRAPSHCSTTSISMPAVGGVAEVLV